MVGAALSKLLYFSSPESSGPSADGDSTSSSHSRLYLFLEFDGPIRQALNDERLMYVTYQLA